MNWEMLTALGQLAAVFVGIPSLIYLAVQIREQTKERRQSAVNVLTAQWGDLTESLHDNAETSAQFFFAACNLSPISIPSPNSGLARSSTLSDQSLRGNVFLPLRRASLRDRHGARSSER